MLLHIDKTVMNQSESRYKNQMYLPFPFAKLSKRSLKKVK